MKKQLLSRKRLTTLFYSLFLMLLCLNSVKVQAQIATTGDYRSAVSGFWSDVHSWQVRDGVGNWTTPGVVPAATNNVYIQNGHTITVDVANGYCNDIQLNTLGVLAIGTNIVNVNGKIRAYTTTLGADTAAIDGTFYSDQTSSTATASTMITTTNSGVLKFVGNTRTIAIAAEWNSSGTSNAAEFALNAGQTGSLIGTGVKFKPLTFSSGIITTDSFISVSTGDLTIKNGARLISSRTAGSNSSAVIGNSSTAVCGIVTIEAGGILELTGSAPLINCTTFTNSGTVIYSKGGTQALLLSGSTSFAVPGITEFNYSTLILSGTSAKTLSNNTTIANNGILSLQGTATLVGSGVVSYGTNATLEYARTNSSTVGIEWPATNSPTNITFKQGTNVSFSNASATPILRTVTGVFNLAFTLGTVGFTVEDNSGTIPTPSPLVPNILTFANGSTIIRTLGTMSTSGGTYVYGTAATDIINLTIAGTPLTSTSELIASPIGKVNLTINAGVTYTLTGGRIVNNLVNNGILVLVPTSTLTFTINGLISGSGTISGNASASMAFTGSLDGSIGTLNFTSGSRFINNLTVGIVGTNSSVTLGTPVTASGIGTTVGGAALLTGASLNLTAGTLIGSSNLTLGIGANINRSVGFLDAAPTFDTSVNVNYSGSNAKTASFEMPSSSTLLNNLTNSTGVVTLSGATKVNGLLTLTSGTITTAANNLTLVSTPVVTTGTIDASNAGATVTFANPSAVVLPATPLFTGNVQNLTINGAGGVTLGSATSLAGKLTLTSGTLATGGLLTLKSGDCCTSATVAQVTGGSVTGNVIVERNIPAGFRAYRLLSPATTGGTINANWQEGGLVTTVGGISNLNLTYGTHITGAGGSANGFDTTTNNASSIFTYDNAIPAWTALANTNGTLTAGSPYLVYIRGSRLATNIDTSLGNDATTLRTIGALTTGTVAVSGLNATANGFSLVGNPYQAQVDMGVVLGAATNLNTGFYYILEPKMGTKGTYVTVNSATGSNNSAGGSTANQYLQPWQACFVQTSANGAASLSFLETNKFEGTQTSVFRKANKTTRLSLALYDTAKLAQNGYPLDGLVVDFDANESNTVNQNDAYKLTNFDENIATSNSNKLLSIESRAIPIDTDEIPLNITKYRGTAYTIKAEGSGLTGSTPYLFDKYTSTTTEIPQDGSVDYAYTVDAAIPASIAADRFKLIYAKTLKTIDNAIASFVLYPNPSKSNSFSVAVPQSMSKVSLSIYNLLGQKLYSQNDLQSGTTVKVTVSNVKTSGVYLVGLTSEGKTVTTKWIVE